MDYSNLSHNELLTKLQDLTKRIIYIERTQMGASTLPQLRQIRSMMMLEASSRMENRKLDMYNKFWPTDQKIIGEEEVDE